MIRGATRISARVRLSVDHFLMILIMSHLCFAPPSRWRRTVLQAPPLFGSQALPCAVFNQAYRHSSARRAGSGRRPSHGWRPQLSSRPAQRFEPVTVVLRKAPDRCPRWFVQKQVSGRHKRDGQRQPLFMPPNNAPPACAGRTSRPVRASISPPGPSGPEFFIWNRRP
jgi:hypothetical protein